MDNGKSCASDGHIPFKNELYCGIHIKTYLPHVAQQSTFAQQSTVVELTDKVEQLETIIIKKDKIITHLTNELKRVRELNDKERVETDRIFKHYGITI